MDLEDAADNSAIDEHIEILVVPFAGRTGGRGALEDQIVLVHFYRVNVVGAGEQHGPQKKSGESMELA